MTVLEGVRIRQVVRLERWSDYRGVRIRDVSGLEGCPNKRCPDYRAVLIREVTVLER